MAPRGADALTTIQLTKRTRDRLKQLGSKGETYDEILNRLLDQAGAPGGSRRVPAKGLVDFEPLD
jgi:hypothetical protein